MEGTIEKNGTWVIKDLNTGEVLQTSDGWNSKKDLEDFLEGMTGIARNLVDDYWMIGDRRVFIGYEWR